MPPIKNCRLCTQSSDNVIEIFGQIGRKLNVYSVITSYFSIHVIDFECLLKQIYFSQLLLFS